MCIFYMCPNKTHKLAEPDRYGMSVSFQYPISMDTGMDVILKNGYKYKYSSTRIKPVLL